MPAPRLTQDLHVLLRNSTAAVALVAALAGSPAKPLAAELAYPLDVAVEENGDVIVADRKLPGVVRIHDGAATVIAQGSKKFRERLNAPWCVAIDAEGKVLVGDSATRAVYRISGDGEPQKINDSYVGIPIRIAVDGEGRIYVSDLETERIWRFSNQGGKGEEFAVVAGVRGLAVDDQNRLWTVRANPPQVVRYAPDGQSETLVNEGPFEFPHQIVVSGSGETAYVSDGYAGAIWKLHGDAAPEKWAAPEGLSPTGMSLQDEHLLVADPKAQKILRVDLKGEASTYFPSDAK
jgi:sugar lactone lactonase YvrE